MSAAAQGWQLVTQVDHAELAGALGRAWGAGDFAEPGAATLRAAVRHDDGWAISDGRPRIDGEGRPLSFLDAHVPPLLSSYRAAVDVAADEDPATGLLVSMHVSGLRLSRYGLAPDRSPGAAPAAPADPAVRRFVELEEERQAHLARELGVPELERWHAYAQLQLLDVLSLLLILSAERSHRLPRAATRPGEAPVEMTLEPGEGTVSVEPYPFAERPLSLSYRRRLLPPGPWSSHESLRGAVAGAAWETAALELR